MPEHDTGCALKPDCPWAHAGRAARLIEKYDGRVPRYTSYPTAVQFGPAIGAEQYRAWLASIPPGRPISLYFHIPFCERLCWYCGCHTGVAHRRAPIIDYVETLKKEIALVSEAMPDRPDIEALQLGVGRPTRFRPVISRGFSPASGTGSDSPTIRWLSPKSTQDR